MSNKENHDQSVAGEKFDQGEAQAPKNDKTTHKRDVITEKDIRKFLADPSVKNASTDKQRAFLIAKGVDEKVVDDLITSESSEDKRSGIEKEIDPQKIQLASQSKPPVITYPEFLVRPQKPPPLVTISGLVDTAYIAAGLAATIYATSKILVEPMFQKLTDARHDFGTHTNTRLQELNDRVSKMTAQPLESDMRKFENSEPTELFHRDVGVQTSPSLSRHMSLDQRDTTKKEDLVVEQHADTLRELQDHLQGLYQDTETSLDTSKTLSMSIDELRKYLNGLVYAPSSKSGFGIWQSDTASDKMVDSIGDLRDEIRAVKGVLLSSRRFAFNNV